MGRLTDVEITNEHCDDHILCIDLSYLDDSNPKTITLWWCGPEGYAAARYANVCDEAMTNLVAMIQEQEKSDRDDEDG